MDFLHPTRWPGRERMPKHGARWSEKGTRSVDEHIAACPKEVRSSLRQLRSAIREVAPDSRETTSYFDMPGYFYPG